MNENFIGILFYDFSFPQGTREVKRYLGAGEYYCPLVECKYDIDHDNWCCWNEVEIQKIADARKEAGLNIKTGKKA